ncbi:MAG: hypothetical protein MR896_03085 [Clostridiales bacterium]|nr:hypothetical protein [Clostridiales bacterium]
MSKKVYFYKVELFDESNNRTANYADIKSLISQIIDRHASTCSDFKVVDLSREEQLHYLADIFDYNDSFLFMRLSAQKPTGSYLHRNYSTNIPNELLEGISEDQEGIEIYTYVLLNYQTGILAYLSQKGAPSVSVLNYFFGKYNNSFSLKLTKIPNSRGIELIYNTPESHISQIEIEVPVPSADMLQSVFHWDQNDILDAQTMENLKFTVRLSADKRKMVTQTDQETQRIIDIIKEKLPFYRKAKLRAKAKNIKTREFNFFEDYYNYPVEIPTYKTVDHHKVYYTANEFVSIYRDHLQMAYYESIDILKEITNR